MRQPLIKPDIFMQSLMLQPEKILRMTMKDYEDLGIIIGMYDSTKCKDGKNENAFWSGTKAGTLKCRLFLINTVIIPQIHQYYTQYHKRGISDQITRIPYPVCQPHKR